MPKSHRILIVEDDVFLVRVYKNLLEKASFEVDFLTDGDEVGAKMATNQYDLVLLDLIMPRKSGFEVLADIKSDVATRDIPVFVLTKLSTKEDKERVMSLGASKFISKVNTSFQDVVQEITTFLN